MNLHSNMAMLGIDIRKKDTKKWCRNWSLKRYQQSKCMFLVDGFNPRKICPSRVDHLVAKIKTFENHQLVVIVTIEMEVSSSNKNSTRQNLQISCHTGAHHGNKKKLNLMSIARWNCCSWRCQCVTMTSSLAKLWYQWTKTPRSHRKKNPTLENSIQRNRIKNLQTPQKRRFKPICSLLETHFCGAMGGVVSQKNRPETGTKPSTFSSRTSGIPEFFHEFCGLTTSTFPTTGVIIWQPTQTSCHYYKGNPSKSPYVHLLLVWSPPK